MLLDRPVTPDSRRPQSSCKRTSTHARRGTGPPPNSADTNKNHANEYRSGGGTPAAAQVGPLPRRREKGRRAPCPPPFIRCRRSRPAAPKGQRVVFSSARALRKLFSGLLADRARGGGGAFQFRTILFFFFLFFVCLLVTQQIEKHPPAPELTHAVNWANIKRT